MNLSMDGRLRLRNEQKKSINKVFGNPYLFGIKIDIEFKFYEKRLSTNKYLLISIPVSMSFSEHWAGNTD